MKERVHHLLNLKASETKHVFDLLRVQLFIGIAHSFTNIAAFTYFIYQFSVEGLPYVYLTIAGGLLFMNVFYEKMEHRFSPLQLLRQIVLISGGILLLFWSGLLVSHDHAIIYILLVWSVLFYMLTGYAYWGLVSLIFNVRESKRVFGIVGAGDIPAKLIGYMTAPLLIPVIGLNNLLVFAIISLGIGLYFIYDLIKKEHAGVFKIKHNVHVHPHAHHHEQKVSLLSLKNNFFLKYRLIFTISLLSLLCYNVFNLIDYTFISQVKVHFKDISVLASFIAIFFGVGRIGALVLKLVFTSRMIERLGVITCLLITPTVLFAFCIAFPGISTHSHFSLYYFGIMALFTEILRSAIQEPAFFILFQPLNEQYRLKGHIIAKGYMLAPSLLIVGASILLMRNLHIELSIFATIKILLVNLFLWAAIVVFIKREYIKTLHRSIAKGVFNGEDIHIYDQRTMEILLDKIKSEQEKENIYALRLLENGNYDKLDELLASFLDGYKTEVKKYALHRLEERNTLDIEQLNRLLSTEQDPEVREKIISCLCRLDPAYLRMVSETMHSIEPAMRKSIIIHLLNQNEFSYLYKAGNEINNLIRSQIAAERSLALDIISELKNIHFTDTIQQLINDPDAAVRRNAISAACKLHTKELLPLIFSQLAQTNNRYLILQGLFQYGDKLFEDITLLPPDEVEERHNDLIKIAGKCKGNHSTQYLLQCLRTDNDQGKIIDALWLKSFQAEKVNDIYDIQQVLQKHLHSGKDKIDLYLGLKNDHAHQLIKNALASEIHDELIISLKSCSILYHKKEVNRFIELILNADQRRIFNAMEMIELVLPKKVSKQVNELVDFVLDPQGLHKKSIPIDGNALMSKVIQADSDSFSNWTRAVCLYTAFKNNETELLQSVPSYTNESPVLTETKNYVLNAVQRSVYADY